MSRSWQGGSTTQWRKIRARVLLANQSENGGRCRLDVGAHCPRHDRQCAKVCTGLATTAHHVRGKRYGDDAAHIIATCAACNLHVGDPAAFNPQPTPRSSW